jgi:hypothetical protein
MILSVLDKDSRTFPRPTAIISMSQDVTHEKLLPPMVDLSNQPVLVAADVEYNIFPYLVGGGKDSPDLGECIPIDTLGDSEPTIKRAPRLGVYLPEGAQFFPGDNVHGAVSSSLILIMRLLERRF